jgi:hypothetical protein
MHLESRLEHEVFRRIAGDEELGKQDQVGAFARRALRAARRTLSALPATSPRVG